LIGKYLYLLYVFSRGNWQMYMCNSACIFFLVNRALYILFCTEILQQLFVRGGGAGMVPWVFLKFPNPKSFATQNSLAQNRAETANFFEGTTHAVYSSMESGAFSATMHTEA
jgi:hypothetical protein